jgi:hypothetical protein
MISRAAVLLVFLTITFSASAASWNDNSHYVSLGSRNGYYIVKPSSPLFRQLGLYEAPIIEMDNNWSLQNLLCSLFGGPAPGSPLVVE